MKDLIEKIFKLVVFNFQTGEAHSRRVTGSPKDLLRSLALSVPAPLLERPDGLPRLVTLKDIEEFARGQGKALRVISRHARITATVLRAGKIYENIP